MGSSSYTPRHGSHHERRRGRVGLLSALRRPVVGGALAVAMLGSVGASMAIGDPSHRATAALTGHSEPDEAPEQDTTTEDTARLADERRSTNVSRSASREQDRRALVERKQKAAAEEKAAEKAKEIRAAKKEKAERAARAEKRRENDAKPVGERHFTAAQLAQIRKDPKPYAVELMRERGWDDDEWGCLDSLWIGESDWEWNATNSSSGAYGIPQSLPANKMASAGADWKTNPITQMEWGLDYIKTSYGSPCEAKSFWDSKDPHWY